MSVVVGSRYIKRTIRTRLLLAIDKILRSLYPLRLNQWIFASIDYYTKEETKQMKQLTIETMKQERERRLAEKET